MTVPGIDRFSSLSTRTRREAASLDPDALALDTLHLIAADPDRLADFLSATGLTRDTLRSAAGEPSFLRGLLDYAEADEGLLRDLAQRSGVGPEAVGLAIARARRDGGEAP